MDRETALQRYRLALSLVSDPTVAGELMVQAKDEGHLRNLANRWREQRGLEAVMEDSPLPVLDEVDEGYALHIARQMVLRRRMSGALLVVGAVALLVLAGASVAVDSQMTLQSLFSLLQPVAGVALLVAGGQLLVRGQHDPAVFLLLAFGGLLVVAGVLNTLVGLYAMAGRFSQIPRWWLLASSIFSLTFWVMIYGTAAYAVWRLWPRPVSVTPRSRG